MNTSFFLCPYNNILRYCWTGSSSLVRLLWYGEKLADHTCRYKSSPGSTQTRNPHIVHSPRLDHGVELFVLFSLTDDSQGNISSLRLLSLLYTYCLRAGSNRTVSAVCKKMTGEKRSYNGDYSGGKKIPHCAWATLRNNSRGKKCSCRILLWTS